MSGIFGVTTPYKPLAGWAGVSASKNWTRGPGIGILSRGNLSVNLRKKFFSATVIMPLDVSALRIWIYINYIYPNSI